MSRIQTRFKELNTRGEGVLIGHLVAGDPDLARSREYARALIAGGMDALALSIPFSDPVANGPVLQTANARALQTGITPPAIFDLARELRQETSIPLVLATYYNPVLAMGEEAFLKRCLEASIDGAIVLDLPIEEAPSLLALARRHRIDTIFSVMPEASDERLQRIAAETTGFLYIASYSETSIPRVRGIVPAGLPLVVELGEADPEQIRAALRTGAQGVTVGNTLAERITAGISPEALQTFMQELKASTRPSVPAPTHTPNEMTIESQKPEMGDGAPRVGS